MQPDYPDGVPAALSRAFTCADDQASWDRGRCRLRLLSYYRMLEADVRADRSEGEARHIVLGVNNTPVNFGGSFHNPVYVLSFSEPDAPALVAGRYGTFISRTDDVARLVEALAEPLRHLSCEAREVIGVALLRVRYSRDTVIEPEPTSDERCRLMVCQKDPADADDREWRVVVTLSGPLQGAPEAIWFSHAPASALPEAAV